MLLKLGVSECGEWKFIFEPEPQPVIVVKSGAQKETREREADLPRALWGFVSPRPLPSSTPQLQFCWRVRSVLGCFLFPWEDTFSSIFHPESPGQVGLSKVAEMFCLVTSSDRCEFSHIWTCAVFRGLHLCGGVHFPTTREDEREIYPSGGLTISEMEKKFMHSGELEK